MLFSEKYKIKREIDEDWFDPILSQDTKLFIDPFLIFQSKDGDFALAHQKIVDFFNYVFTLIAKSCGSVESTHYKKALNTLIFPEPRELCLGYAFSSTKGSGSSFGFSSVIASAIWNSIKAGIKQIEHFEELSIFNEGIGADRISDITANILKSDLIVYTQKVCRNHKIPVEKIRVRNSSFDNNLKIWNSEKISLPLNPFTNKPVLLIPSHFLRPLPVINHEDFWDYICNHENEIIRNNFSYHIKETVNKKDIVQIAKTNLQLVQRYIGYTESHSAKPYELDQDPENLYRWYTIGKEFVQANPLNIQRPKTSTDLLTVVDKIIDHFKHYIEFQKGYELLWINGRPRSEAAAQRLFMGIASSYCEANDIDPSKEENLGSGPVDFKFSKGFIKRILIEMKLAKNTKFWNGLLAQLPQYLKTEKIVDGIFLIIVYSKEDLKRVSGISKIILQINEIAKVNIKYILIDAMSKASASKLKFNLDLSSSKSEVTLPKITEANILEIK